MSRSVAAISIVGIALLLSGAARAERLGKGRSLVSVAVGGHRGQSVVAFTSFLGLPGAVGRYESGEVGGEIEYCRFLSDQWTLGIGGGYHFSRTSTTEYGLGTDVTETHSFTARIGGDRYAFIDDNVALFAGPGVVFTRGRWKDSDTGGFVEEGPEATELGLNGRIGMYARVARRWALVGHIGQVLSHTSGKNSDGKVSWWASTHEGSVGLAFDF